MLAAQGFADAPFVRGSALQALHGTDTGCIEALLEVMDTHLPVPTRDLEAPFLMPIENTHTITGRGTVVSGRVERGTIAVGASVELVGRVDGKPRTAIVTGIQSFHKDIPAADAGLNVGLLLRGVDRDEVARGQVLVAPGSMRPHKRGRAEIFTLGAHEGGRHTPFGTGYSPQLFFGAADVSAVLDVGERGSVSPGERAEVGFDLHRSVACEPGMRFAIREGGRTVGAGIVVEVDA